MFTTHIGLSLGFVEHNRLFYVFGEVGLYLYGLLLTCLLVYLVYRVHRECRRVKYSLLILVVVRVACVINNSFLLLCYV